MFCILVSYKNLENYYSATSFVGMHIRGGTRMRQLEQQPVPIQGQKEDAELNLYQDYCLSCYDSVK
jgi:hypothetical protein